jgi:glutaredoxin 2
MKIDQLVETYIKLRSKLSQLDQEYDEKKRPFKEAQDKIEALMLTRFGELGVDSMKTQSGTAYVTVRTSASVGDWDSFREFLDRQDDPFMFVERRVSKVAVEQYKAANADIPPGVSWNETRAVNFRRT